MGQKKFDVIIVGLGAMGSAAAYHLARRGYKVLGFDRFAPPHAFGSSHGQTRFIREAYYEHPLYVPLVQRAYELWTELEEASGQSLLRLTGGLMIGHRDGELVTGVRRSAGLYSLTYNIFDPPAIQQKFPAFHLTDDMIGVLEPRAGILFIESCIEAHLELARRHGAIFHFEEPVGGWETDHLGASVQTAKGQYQAERLLLAVGPWLPRQVAGVTLPLTVERQVMFWFEPASHPEYFDMSRCPIYIWEYAPNRFFYGYPDYGVGIKVGRHHEGEISDPSSVRRDVTAEEIEEMRGLLHQFMPDAAGALKSSAVCLYTNTPDSHFIIDIHPIYSRVLIASPCSGHGFKFSSVIGEVLADLLTEGHTRFDLSPFQLDRLIS